ncbi:MAG: dihydropteroate synthase [Kofleriaceae bacterium]
MSAGGSAPPPPVGPPPILLRGHGGTRAIALDAPLIMGVVNVTPDSFSDGGRLADAAAAIAHGQALWRAGADLLDVGGEATNPRAQPVSAEVEAARVVPVIAGLAATTTAIISVDTTKAAVAAAAIAAGALVVNDVAGGQFDPALWAVADAAGVGYVLGHLRGRTLAEVFAAEAPVGWREVADELAARVAALPPGLVARTWIDPGLGVGKGGDADGNLALLGASGALARAVGRPVLVGPSRKRFLAAALGAAVPVEAGPRQAMLDDATVGACLAAVAAGAHVVRVHDVARVRAALAVFRAVPRSFVATADQRV